MKFKTLIDELGEPALLTERNAATRPEHWAMWLCGCIAVNMRGLCLPSGWKLQRCPDHGRTVRTRRTPAATQPETTSV
jgi:hypothetical protein